MWNHYISFELRTLNLELNVNEKPPAPASGTEGFRVATQLAQRTLCAARLRCMGRAPAIRHRPLRGGSQFPPAALHHPTALCMEASLPFPIIAAESIIARKGWNCKGKNPEWKEKTPSSYGGVYL